MGLLDGFFGTPEQTQALGLLGAGLMAGNPAQAFGNANAFLAEAPDRAMKRQLTGMQLQNLQSEIDARKLATLQDQRKQSILEELFPKGGVSQPSMPGQLGSGSFGAVQPPAGMPAIPPAMTPTQSLASRLTPDMLARLKLGAGVDLTDIAKFARPDMQVSNGYAYDRNAIQPGFLPQLNIAQNGQASLVHIGPDGLPRVSLPAGAALTQAQNTIATKLPEQVISAAGRVNLRKNADGTESPVPELSENPVLQNFAGQVFGAAPGRFSMSGPQPAVAPNGHPVISAADQKGADAETLALLQSEQRKPGADVAGLQREIDRIQRSQTQQGFPTPTIRNPQGYGMTTQQQAQADANKEQVVQQAKDVAEQRKSIMNAGFVAPTNIAKYQQIGRLLADVDGGKYTPAGTELASALNGFGIKIDKNLPNKEAAAALANQAALELRSPAGGAGMPGAMSDSDRQFLASMTPSMTQSAQGRKMVIDSYVAVQTRNQQVADFARKYEKKYGKLDNGFFDQLSAWSSANPLFKAQ